MMGLFVTVVFVLAGCGGGGGGNSSSAAPNAPSTYDIQQTTPKISIADGYWIITKSALSTTYPTYLDSCRYVDFKDGNVWAGDGISYVRTGIFSVVGDALSYTFTRLQYGTIGNQTVSDIFNGTGTPSTYTSVDTLLTARANVSLSGNTMTWKDSSGNIVAIFTK